MFLGVLMLVNSNLNPVKENVWCAYYSKQCTRNIMATLFMLVMRGSLLRRFLFHGAFVG